jgi:hypothetical protein
MRREYFSHLFLIVSCLLLTFSAHAQEVVHALCGTVRSINSNAKTITFGTYDGTNRLFGESTDSNVRIDFDKRIRADAIAADAFTKSGARAIVYYFGNGDHQTAVALQDLGAGPFEDIGGTVAKFDQHEHVLTLKTDSGADETFHIVTKTVAETPYGAIEGLELDVKDGDQLRVTPSSANGIRTALFIRTI